MIDALRELLAWGRLDPYLVWAEATGSAGMPLADGMWIPVIAQAPGPEVLVQLRTHLESAKNAGVAAVGTPAGQDALCFTLLVRQGRHREVLGILSSLGVRWELSLPIASPDAAGRDLPDAPTDEPGFEKLRTSATRPRAPGQVIGFIDYGCAFAHRQFRCWEKDGRASGRSRVFALWDQQSSRLVAPRGDRAAPDWNPVPGFAYGREWRRSRVGTRPGTLGIDDYIAQFSRHGAIDEEACYAMSGYTALQSPVAHGTHIMDVAAGYPDPLLPPGAAWPAPPQEDIVFVQLPRFFDGRQVTGLLRSYVLDAVEYIFRCAQPDQPVTINLSYGAYAGAHDGTSILEEALDEAIRRRRATGPTEIVIAAGNGADSRTHVAVELAAAGAPQAQVALKWGNIPDNPTDQFTEVWLFGSDTSGCEVRFTPPGEQAVETAWVPVGDYQAIEREGRHVAMVIAPREVCQGRHGRMVLVAVGPTVRRDGRPAAPYGQWTLEVRNHAAHAVRVEAWIERDDPVFQSAGGPRQARFEDDAHLDASNTLNSIAGGKLTTVVGGLVGGSLRQPDYSARGPRKEPNGIEQRPGWLAICEESDALPGIAAAAVIGRERVRLPGTSISAAVATRWVVARQARPASGLPESPTVDGRPVVPSHLTPGRGRPAERGKRMDGRPRAS